MDENTDQRDAKPGRIGMTYWLIATVVRAANRVFARREWQGGHHLPVAGGYITVINHNSYVDAFAYGHFQYDSGKPPHFFVKASLFKVPVLGAALRATGQIPVERRSTRAADSLRAAYEAVRSGECVAIYPEGTLTRDPELWPGPPKTGAARLALMTRAPVIPVAQWGAHELVPPYARGGRRVRLRPRPTLVVHAGPPVDLSDLYDAGLTVPVLREASSRIMDAVVTLLEDIRGEKRPSGYGT
ncbi:lysophospholipid acyltransferase family protein [Streptomyces sp. CB03238]|uniref:lysophospholipid acyltransferase family protein n=1 Tax=Streptomyces sp. CB03238 TaxID=1907777 RepID=UPI000A10D881|nr:lysophospholipid acyltransferase family protein [Streptomyces sp. CB03238]ORT59093.1 1-acyl-sn-glycerol-3-phosphate acyltransferase [Streptomyces sp. CB03238]